METIEFILEMFGGPVFLIGFGCLVGRLLKLDNFSENQKKRQQIQLRKTDIPTKETGTVIQDNDL